MTVPAKPTHTPLQWGILAVALVLVGVLATWHSYHTPLFEPPDELLHYQFVHTWLADRVLPIQQVDGPLSQSHQPPLYYLGGALLVAGIVDPQTLPERNLFWAANRIGEVSYDNKLQFLPNQAYAPPYQGTALVVHRLRLWSVVLALMTTAVVWLLGITIWANAPAKVALMLALSVLNPMFLYIAGAVNNDNLIILCGTVMLWFVVRALADAFSWRTTIFIGLVWGIAILSKLTGIVLAVSWGVGLICVAWQKRDIRLLLTRTVVIVGIMLSVAGWWFWRNYQLYGDPLALQIVLDVWGERAAANTGWMALWTDVRFSWTNFWGRFGYGQIPLPPWVYALFTATSIVAVAGSLRRLAHAAPTRRPLWWVMLAVFTTYVAALFYYIYRNPTGANGRYVYPALAAFAALAAGGLSAWWRQWSRPFIGYTFFITLMLGLALYSVGFLHETYAPPPRYTHGETLSITHPVDITYPGLATLLGYDVAPETAVPGESVAVTLYWQVIAETDQNYPLFLQLVNHQGERIVGRDTHPGLGRYPTSRWQAGEIIADTIPLAIPQNAVGPTALHLDMGLWNPTGDILSTIDGSATNTLGLIRLNGTTINTPVGQPVQYHLDDVAALIAVAPPPQTTLSEKENTPITLPYTLTWQALAAPTIDYVVFVHLWDDDGTLVQTYDGPPQAGAFPTHLWQPADIVIDARQMVLPERLAAGTYHVLAGWYRLDDLTRLPVTDAAGQAVPDAAIPLFTFVVEE